MPKKEAGAGRGFVNPKPVNVSEEDYVTPAQHYDMRRQQMDAAEAAAAEKAYDKARTTSMAKGGTASARADGCAIRGKTRGKMV